MNVLITTSCQSQKNEIKGKYLSYSVARRRCCHPKMVVRTPASFKFPQTQPPTKNRKHTLTRNTRARISHITDAIAGRRDTA